MDRPLNIGRTGQIAAIDIGSSKVCCFIGQADSDGGLKVLGLGHQAAGGMRAGAIVDMEAVETSVLAAIHGAETMAGENIHEAYVNVSAGQPVSGALNVEIPVAGNEVSRIDVERVLEEGRHRTAGSDRTVLHFIPVGYRVDSQAGVRDPRGMYGGTLGADIHVVTAGAGAVRNLTTCLNACQIEVTAMVVSPYAAALATMVEDEMELGATLIDMGGGTTSIAAFINGGMVYTDTIPVGGNHVTNDIALGLSTPVSQAERIKALYGTVVASPGDDEQMIDVPILGEEEDGAMNQIPRSLLVGIIRPRLEETFELVRERLDSYGLGAAARRIVLTGGASQLQGMKQLAEPMLDRQVRIGRPLNFTGLAQAACGPAFSVTAGLLKYAAQRHAAEPTWVNAVSTAGRGMFGRFGGWLRENF